MSLDRRRRLWLAAGGVLGGAVLAAGLLLPTPFVELAPGPTFNTLGEHDGVPIIQIERQPTYPTSGHLDMTTVNERGGPGGGVYLGRVLVGWADPSVRIVPREVFYPDGQSSDEVTQETVQQFNDSENNAITAALRYLHKPVVEVVIVSGVVQGGPSDGILAPGDQILAVQGTPVRTVPEVAAILRSLKPGQVVRLRVRHDKGGISEVSVTTKAAPDDPSRAYLGVTIGTTQTGTFPIDITLGGVGGPSAGTMLSLGIIDKLTPGDLTGGRYVAGTGTIDPDGTVGPIGGIEQKMIGARRNGATLFLAPASNCTEVVDGGIPSGLTVAKVATLTDAVNAVESYVGGKPVTGCT